MPALLLCYIHRSIPPLRHSWVWALKRDFPNLSFTLNGGVSNSSEALALLSTEVEGQKIDGVMVVCILYKIVYRWSVRKVTENELKE